MDEYPLYWRKRNNPFPLVKANIKCKIVPVAATPCFQIIAKKRKPVTFEIKPGETKLCTITTRPYAFAICTYSEGDVLYFYSTSGEGCLFWKQQVRSLLTVAGNNKK